MLSVREPLHPHLSAALETFVLLVDRQIVRAEWRSVCRGSGGLCVMVDLGEKRQLLCAGN